MSRADDDYDDRPRRRRRDDDYADDYDDRPRKAKAGGGTNVWVIVGVVVGLMFCCGVAAVPALLLPAVQKVREAAARQKDTNNFKQIALAVHAHHDKTAELPKADGGLSVRVHLLPFLEQENLHRRFDLKQGWDSPANRPLADTSVPVYGSALDEPGFTQTRVRVFVGPDTLFPPGERPLRLAEVKDGASNTFLAVEAAESVPWPQPRELEYRKGGPLPALGHPNRPSGALVLMLDGSVRFMPKSTGEPTIRAGITANGGEAMPGF